MRMGTRTLAVCAVVCVQAATAAAQGRTLTLAEVLARAREQAPQIVSARLALEEARGRLLGASVRSQANPEIDASLGNRNGTGVRYTDFQLGLGQSFEPGARRSARVDGANAAIAQGSANIDEVTRTVLRRAASAYYRAVHANDRIRVLIATQEVAQSVYATADRRFKAGDIALLDVNIARASLGRVRAEREGAEASKALALGELRQLLRLEPDVSVEGWFVRPGDSDLNAALQSALLRLSYEDSKPPFRKQKPNFGSASASRSPNRVSAWGPRGKKVIRSSPAVYQAANQCWSDRRPSYVMASFRNSNANSTMTTAANAAG